MVESQALVAVCVSTCIRKDLRYSTRIRKDLRYKAVFNGSHGHLLHMAERAGRREGRAERSGQNEMFGILEC